MSIASVHRRAFTLRELFAVIGVITILLALSVSAIQRSREAARLNQCQNNLIQLDLGLLNYYDKRNCLPPISSSVDSLPEFLAMQLRRLSKWNKHATDANGGI